ncbi:MAG: transglycosylase SLT domain-containing protein [Holosporales bacterium]|nr:transglycosylase SLT domain-containing protein [Holosporales bacterium]
MCAHECAWAFIKAEKKYNIPPYLLRAISAVESGRRRTSTHDVYPWTVCINGHGYFCANKTAAVEKIKNLKERGENNVDVGLMQINLRYHGCRFMSVSDMIDPVKNVDFAARHLKQLYRRTGSWQSAVALYHSSNTGYSTPYKNKVFTVLDKIKNSARAKYRHGAVILASMRSRRKSAAVCDSAGSGR